MVAISSTYSSAAVGEVASTLLIVSCCLFPPSIKQPFTLELSFSLRKRCDSRWLFPFFFDEWFGSYRLECVPKMYLGQLLRHFILSLSFTLFRTRLNLHLCHSVVGNEWILLVNMLVRMGHRWRIIHHGCGGFVWISLEWWHKYCYLSLHARRASNVWNSWIRWWLVMGGC